MHPKDCFTRLIQHVEKMGLVPSFRRELTEELSYFLEQAASELVHRDHPSVIRDKWLSLSQKTQGLKLFESFQKEDMFWRTLKCFVHLEEPASLLVPREERREPKSPYAKWTPVDLFNHLSKEAKTRVHLSPYENLSLTMGLWFLESEAAKGRGQRKPERIKATWKHVHPILEKLGLMAEFKQERGLRDQVSFFINDSMEGDI